MNIKQTFIKLFQLQNNELRKSGLKLLILVTLTGFLEAAGIASIMPFLAIIGNPDVVNQNQFLNSVYSFLHNHFFWVNSVDHFLILLGLFSFVFILRSGIFRLTDRCSF